MLNISVKFQVSWPPLKALWPKFSSFANFEEKKRKSSLLMSFPKTGNKMGSFGQIRKNSFFRFCWPILDIFRFTLLNTARIYILPVKYSDFQFSTTSVSSILWYDSRLLQHSKSQSYKHCTPKLGRRN